MRRIILAVSLLVASLSGVVGATPAQASTTVTFTYTGSAQTWTVPTGVTSVDLTVKGAGGGGSAFPGGRGAGVQITNLSVTPGETLTLRIGGGGQGSVREVRSAPLLLAQRAVPEVAGQNDYYEPGAGGGSTIVEYSADNNFLVVAGGGGGSVGALVWTPGPTLLTLSGGAGGRTGGDGTIDEDREFSAACGGDVNRCSKGGTSAGIGGLAGTYAGSGGNWPNGFGGWSGADGVTDRVTGGQPGGPGGAYSDPIQDYSEHGGSGGAGYGGGSGGSSRSGGAWGGGGGGSSYASVPATFTTGGGGAGGVAFTDLGTPTRNGLFDEYSATNPGADGSVTIAYTFNAPTLTSVSPASGQRSGGQSITLNGTGFRAGATVTIGGASAPVTAISPDGTQITATTPAGGSAAADVVVTNSDAQSATLAGGFSYAPPTISSINPTSGGTAGGTTVAVSGTGFIAPVTVTVGGASATNVSVTSQSALTFETPTGSAGSTSVIITSVGQSASTTFTYVAPAPNVTSISPSSGARAGGTNVTITGTNFQSGATVTIGGVNATSVSVDSATQITAATPAGGSAAADVVVTNTDAQSGTLAGGFAYNPPTISSINPTGGTTAGGTNVTMSGTGFIAPITITVGGANATNVNIASQTSLTFDTPAGVAGPAVDVVLTSVGQSVTASSAFTYSNPLPTITSFTPTSGSKAGGDAVVITGTGFLTGAAVTFDGVSSPSVTVDSATQITAITPGGTSATAAVVVTNTDANSVTAGSTFEYINPSISSISPTSGTTSGGTTVTINGAGLMDASNVFVDGDLATIVSNTSSQIVITTPSTSSGPGIVPLEVVVAGISATTNYQYTSPAPLISNVSPNSGSTAGNTSVTITGTDLGGASSVTFASNPATIVSNTPTEIVVISPPGSAGAAQIQVTVGAQSTTANFTYGAVPQAPTGLSATALDQSASITFTAGSDGGSQITDYEYEVDGSFWQSAGTDSSPVTVTGLTNGTTYSIRLRAVNANGEGAASSPVTVTPVGSGARPGAPTSLAAIPADAALVLSWTAPSPGDSPISDYEFSTDGSTWVSLLSTSTSTTISTDSSGNGLMNGQPYSVQIRAMNNDGAGTASSAVTQTPGIPLAPQNPSATWDEDALNLQWTAGNDNGDPITDYRLVVSAPIARSAILMSRSGPGTYTTSSTSYTVTGLDPGFDYTITFTAQNGRGWGLSTTLRTGAGPSPSGEDVAPPVIWTLAIDPGEGARCSATTITGVSGTWVELPTARSCTPNPAIPQAQLLGWATRPGFPIQIAQRQVDNGWGPYELFDPTGRISSVFVPVGRPALIYAEGTLFAVWSAGRDVYPQALGASTVATSLHAWRLMQLRLGPQHLMTSGRM